MQADDIAAASAATELQPAQSAVNRAWRSVLGARSLSENLTLAQAGCDSISLLQFVLIVEQTLRRPVPLDIIGFDMRPPEIAAALFRAAGQTGQGDALPVVFLFPGLDDDEQRLARFRGALQDRIRFILIEYPDWPQMLAPGWGFAHLIESVVKQIQCCHIGTPVMFTGYSFGGEVAFAAACRLVALGWPVRWLGVLDTDVTHVPQPLSGGLAERLRRYTAEIVNDVRHDRLHKILGLFLAKLARQGPGLASTHRTARWWRPLLPLRTQFWFDRRTRSILRMRALWSWQDAAEPGTLGAPVTLFRSQAPRASSPFDLGWGPRCPALSIVSVPGDHHTLFDPPQRDVLYARYAEVMAGMASTPARHA